MPINFGGLKFTSGSLPDLLATFPQAPKVDPAEMHLLDIHLCGSVYSVGAVLELASMDASVGKHEQQLTRYVMLDVARMMDTCQELRIIAELLPVILKAISRNPSAPLRRSLLGDIKQSAIYRPLTPITRAERYHLWAWDDKNRNTIDGLIKKTKFSPSIVSAFAAGSLLSLDADVVGGFGEELSVEFDHAVSKIKTFSEFLGALPK